jgi:hypothetical protein
MNERARFGDKSRDPGAFAMHNKAPCADFAREAIMTSQMMAFAIEVGGTSLVCHLLMTRLRNRRTNRSAPDERLLA